MLFRWSCRSRFLPPRSCLIRSASRHRSFASAAQHGNSRSGVVRTRNIGIIAHIDAGKTTTTERALFYANFTRSIGDVDEGSTVTDFLPAERARGITIQSAAISFFWPPSSGNDPETFKPGTPRSFIPHNINLIDTPGHADFTFEVLRSLRVLDGAVCILDGVAGVEAQTEKVWSQASAYAIPKIIYVNKLDRDGAAFGQTVKQVGARLGVWPAVCGIPWWTGDGRLQGVGDAVGLRGLRYAEGGDGKDIRFFNLQDLDAEDAAFAGELKLARIALIERLSEHDDEMVERYLEANEDHLSIFSNDIVKSLRRCVLQNPQQVAPIYAGASFRNIGVQPLLDAVVDLLPSPEDCPDPEVSLNNDTKGGLSNFLSGKLVAGVPTTTRGTSKAVSNNQAATALLKLEACALAFKVVADPKRGVLVYIRVYSGTVSRNVSLWNTNLQTTERAPRLLKMYANEAVDIESIPAGQIGVIPALKFARTGDTLISYAGANPRLGPPRPINTVQLRPIEVPPPVFFVSVEPNSLAEQKHIKDSLDLLLREDPSLHVSQDEESGQTHLAGMGELHLEIARDRLVSDLKAKARIGTIEIGYREAVTTLSGEVTEVFDRDVGGKSSKAACVVAVKPMDDVSTDGKTHSFDLLDNNRLHVLTPTLNSDGTSIDPEKAGLPEHLSLPTVLQSLSNGVSAALARGPNYGYPVHSTLVNIELDPTSHLFPNSTPAAVSSAARLGTQRALKASSQVSETVMMEPVMLATISVDEDSLGSVVHDISSTRGGSVVSLGADEQTENSGQDIDVTKIYAPPDPFAGGHTNPDARMGSSGNQVRQIIARVPLKEMVGYLKHLRSLTGGRGTFTMTVDQFEKMSSQRQRAVLNEIRGDYV